MVVYRYLTNVELHRGDVWPGALFGTVLFQVSFQALPLYLRFSDSCSRCGRSAAWCSCWCGCT